METTTIFKIFKKRLQYGIISVVLSNCLILFISVPASSLPRFDIKGSIRDEVTKLVTALKVQSAIKQQALSMSNEELMNEALHGRLGACTYARIPAGSPLSSVAFGVISTGERGTSLNLAGPVTTNNLNLPSSGLVLKSSILKGRLRSSLRDLYGGSTQVDEAAQVATALKNIIQISGRDVCKLTQYSTKLATEMNRMRGQAKNFQNIVFKKEGDGVRPDQCAVRENVVPVSNRSNFLDEGGSSSGCAYTLIKMSSRICLHFYNKNKPISGYQALSAAKFDNSVQLRNRIQQVPAAVLAALTASFQQKYGLALIADLDFAHTQISGFKAISPQSDSQKQSAFTNLPAEVKDILKIYHANQTQTLGGQALSTAIGSSYPNLVSMTTHFLNQISNHSLPPELTSLVATTNNPLATNLLPSTPAFQPHTVPVDQLADIAEITYNSGTTVSIKGPGSKALSISAVNNCLSLDASIAAKPHSIGLVHDTLAPVPQNPVVNTTWVNLNTSYTLSSQSISKSIGL